MITNYNKNMNKKNLLQIKFNKGQIWQAILAAMIGSGLRAVEEGLIERIEGHVIKELVEEEFTERILTEERKKQIVKIASEEIREAKEQLSVRAETTIEDLERRSMLSLLYMRSIFLQNQEEKTWRRTRGIQLRQEWQRIIRDRIINGIMEQREEDIDTTIRFLENITMEGQGREIQEIRRIAIEGGRIEGRMQGAVEAVQIMLESLVYRRP